EGMSEVTQGAGFKTILFNSYITGQLDITAFELQEVIPFIGGFLPEASLIKIADATPKMRLKDFSILFEADVKLFEKLTLAKVDLRIGNYAYDNYLLNIPEEDTTGFYMGARNELA